jgi:hypothetical protein
MLCHVLYASSFSSAAAATAAAFIDRFLCVQCVRAIIRGTLLLVSASFSI